MSDFLPFIDPGRYLDSLKMRWDRFDAWLFDGDGVLYEAGGALPGAVELLKYLSESGVPTALVTNNSTKTMTQYEDKLSELDLELSTIVTSAYTAVELLQADSAFVIGERGIFDACEKEGIVTDPSEYDVPDVVIVGMDTGLTYDKLALGVHYILQGARFIATNPDRTFPVGSRLAPGAGSMIAAVSACVDRSPEFIAGKPGPMIFERALDKLGVRNRNVVMVGDRYETDILGGKMYGLTTVMVKTGVASHYSEEKLREIIGGENPPDFIFSGLPELLKEVRR